MAFSHLVSFPGFFAETITPFGFFEGLLSLRFSADAIRDDLMIGQLDVPTDVLRRRSLAVSLPLLWLKFLPFFWNELKKNSEKNIRRRNTWVNWFVFSWSNNKWSSETSFDAWSYLQYGTRCGSHSISLIHHFGVLTVLLSPTKKWAHFMEKVFRVCSIQKRIYGAIHVRTEMDDVCKHSIKRCWGITFNRFIQVEQPERRPADHITENNDKHHSGIRGRVS